MKPYVFPKPGTHRAKRSLKIQRVVVGIVVVGVPLTIFVLVKKNQKLTKNLKSCDTSFHEILDAHVTLKENYRAVSERLLNQFMDEVPEVYIRPNQELRNI